MTSWFIQDLILSILACEKNSCCSYHSSILVLALEVLHLRHAGTKLFRLLEPDLNLGITWSKLVASSSQYPHLWYQASYICSLNRFFASLGVNSISSASGSFALLNILFDCRYLILNLPASISTKYKHKIFVTALDRVPRPDSLCKYTTLSHD